MTSAGRSGSPPSPRGSRRAGGGSGRGHGKAARRLGGAFSSSLSSNRTSRLFRATSGRITSDPCRRPTIRGRSFFRQWLHVPADRSGRSRQRRPGVLEPGLVVLAATPPPMHSLGAVADPAVGRGTRPDCRVFRRPPCFPFRTEIKHYLGHLVVRLLAAWPDVRISLRDDNGSAVPKTYLLCGGPCAVYSRSRRSRNQGRIHRDQVLGPRVRLRAGRPRRKLSQARLPEGHDPRSEQGDRRTDSWVRIQATSKRPDLQRPSVLERTSPFLGRSTRIRSTTIKKHDDATAFGSEVYGTAKKIRRIFGLRSGRAAL